MQRPSPGREGPRHHRGLNLPRHLGLCSQTPRGVFAQLLCTPFAKALLRPMQTGKGGWFIPRKRENKKQSKLTHDSRQGLHMPEPRKGPLGGRQVGSRDQGSLTANSRQSCPLGPLALSSGKCQAGVTTSQWCFLKRNLDFLNIKALSFQMLTVIFKNLKV